MNNRDVRLPRPVRKTIFSLRLWRPARQRHHSQRLLLPGPRRPLCTRVTDIRDLSLGCVNARSARNKTATLNRSIIDEQLDVLVITETWHEHSESAVLKRVTPPGFQCIDAARPIPPATRLDTTDFHNFGGLAFIHRNTIDFQKRCLDIDVTTFEYLCGYASTNNSHFLLLGAYRPGSQPVTAAFFDELSAVFEQLLTYQCPVVICGDFNIHVDQGDDVHAARLLQLLQEFDCSQRVTKPTHTAGHTLDLVIARADTDIVDLRVGDISPTTLSCGSSFEYRDPCTASVHQSVSCRAWRRLSQESFAADLSASKLCCDLDMLGDMDV